MELLALVHYRNSAIGHPTWLLFAPPPLIQLWSIITDKLWYNWLMTDKLYYNLSVSLKETSDGEDDPSTDAYSYDCIPCSTLTYPTRVCFSTLHQLHLIVCLQGHCNFNHQKWQSQSMLGLWCCVLRISYAIKRNMIIIRSILSSMWIGWWLEQPARLLSPRCQQSPRALSRKNVSKRLWNMHHKYYINFNVQLG